MCSVQPIPKTSGAGRDRGIAILKHQMKIKILGELNG